MRDRFSLYQGRVEVTGLPPGAWELRLEAADGRVLSAPASTPATGVVVLE